MAGPLKGLKILDFTTLLPGPYATMTLADLGAEVLRIVSGSRPDLAAFLPPFLPGTNLSCATAYLGRGKRCMALNLKDPRAGAIVRRLVADYDILIEQFRPGVMAKFGLDYETLKAANPAPDLLLAHRLRPDRPPEEPGGPRHQLPRPLRDHVLLGTEGLRPLPHGDPDRRRRLGVQQRGHRHPGRGGPPAADRRRAACRRLDDRRRRRLQCPLRRRASRGRARRPAARRGS